MHVRVQPAEDPSAEPTDGAPAKDPSAEPADGAPAEPDETRAEAAEVEWAAVRV